MSLALVLEGIVAALLGVTVGFCVVLNRRLLAVHAVRDDLRRLIADFDKSLERARQSIGALKSAGEEAGQELQARIDRARVLADELAHVGGTGGPRLASPRQPAWRGGAPAAERPTGDAVRSEAERELMQALRGRR